MKAKHVAVDGGLGEIEMELWELMVQQCAAAAGVPALKCEAFGCKNQAWELAEKLLNSSDN